MTRDSTTSEEKSSRSYWGFVLWPVALVVLALASVLFDGCRDSSKSTESWDWESPDSKYVATAFIKGRGWWTNYGSAVYLRRAGEPLEKSASVFIGTNSDQIGVEWLSASQLVVSSDCKVIKHITNYDGVVIEARHVEVSH